MFKNKKIIVVMPAYNAAKTLQRTYDEVMEQGIVDLVILVDDASQVGKPRQWMPVRGMERAHCPGKARQANSLLKVRIFDDVEVIIKGDEIVTGYGPVKSKYQCRKKYPRQENAVFPEITDHPFNPAFQVGSRGAYPELGPFGLLGSAEFPD